MKKQLFFILLIFAISPVVKGQEVLNKKDVAIRIDQISALIKNKEFEEAMLLFNSKTEIIVVDNVRKNLREDFYSIKTTLDQKENEFKKNEEKVAAFQNQYESGDYCSAISLLDLNLTKENSFQSTQNIKTKLYNTLLDARIKCNDFDKNITQWNQDYKNQDYEKIFPIYKMSDEELKYLSKQNTPTFNDLKSKLADRHLAYWSVRFKIIELPESKIASLNFDSLNYNQSLAMINDFNNILAIQKSEIQKLDGNNPLLLQQFSELKPKIQKTIEILSKFCSSNKPFSRADIEEYLTRRTTKLSIEQIMQNFTKINGAEMFYSMTGKDLSEVSYDGNFSLLGSEDAWEEKSVFRSVFDEDVYTFYNLNEEYNSILQKKVFEETEEYKSYLNELVLKKNQVLEGFYYLNGFGLNGQTFTQEFDENSYQVNYNLNKSGFPITINHVYPYKCSRYFIPKTISDIEFPNIPVTKVYDVRHQGKDSYREVFLITVSEKNALEMENDRSNIEIILLFQINGIEKRKLNDIDFQRANKNNYGCKNSVDVIASKNLRLVVYNTKTNKIYFDEVY